MLAGLAAGADATLAVGDPNCIRLCVSPSGDDAAPGSESEPLRTPQGVRDAIARLRGRAESPLPVEVVFADGRYHLDEAVALTAADSGSPECPVVWRAANRGKAVFSAETPLTWEALEDEDVLRRLPACARGHVLVARVPGTGPLPSFLGGAHLASANVDIQMELFDGDRRLTCARYPNEGLAEVSQIDATAVATGGRNTNTVYFTYADGKLAEWADEPFPWVFGLWGNEWSETKHPLTIQPSNPSNPPLRVAVPAAASQFGITAKAKFYVFNAFCELDMPGEWVADLERRLVYLWPLESPNPQPPSALLSGNLLTATAVTDFTLDGIVFEKCRKTAIVLRRGCARVNVRGCTVRHTCEWGVTTTKTTDCHIEGCDLYDLGEGGIELDGGDMKTLTYGNNVADNNHIHHYGKVFYDYKQGVSLRGTGNAATHNLIHHSNHTGIYARGNDHYVGWNVIHDTCEYNDDAGAIYVYNYSWVLRGGTIEHNLILRTGKKCNAANTEAIYLDDYSSEATVRHNVVNHATRGLLLGGGQSNEIYGNAMLNCNFGMAIGSRYGWANSEKGRQSANYVELDADYATYTSPLWLGHYPGLARLIAVEDPVYAHHAFWNVVTNNASWHAGASTRAYWNVISNTTTWTGNVLLGDADPCFEDYAGYRWNARADSPCKALLDDCRIDEMGLYDSPCRASPAVKFGEGLLPAPTTAPKDIKPSVSFRLSFGAAVGGLANCTSAADLANKRSLRHEIWVPPSAVVQAEAHEFTFVPSRTENVTLTIHPGDEPVELRDLAIVESSNRRIVESTLYPLPSTLLLSLVSNQPVVVSYRVRRTDGFKVAAGETLTLSAAEIAELENVRQAEVEAGATLVLDIGAGESVVFAPQIVGGGAVRVVGTGSVAFAATNAFTGGFTLAGSGCARATNAMSFGATNVPLVVTASGATLAFAAPARPRTAADYWNPVDIRATNGTVRLRFDFTNATAAVNFHGAIVSAAPETFVMGNCRSWCDDGERTVNFWGAVTAPGRIFGKTSSDYLANEMFTMNFRGKVTCGVFLQDCFAWGRGYFHFFAANAIGEASPAIAAFQAECDGAWDGAVLSADRNRKGYHGGTSFDFKGHSMTVAGFKSYDISLPGTGLEILRSSTAPMTLTVTGGVFEHNGHGPRTIAKINEGVSLVWAPADGGTGVFYNCTHLTEGTVTVSNGTFATEGNVRFPNLSGIFVCPGAAFELDTTAGERALPALGELFVGAGGSFRAVCGTMPFADGRLALTVGDATASVELPAGFVLYARKVTVDGKRLAEGTYAPSDLAWLKGADVSLVVGERNFWQGGDGGRWLDAANWTVDVPSATLGAIVDAEGTASVRSVIDGVATADDVDIRSFGTGTSRVEVVDGGALALSDYVGRIRVGAGISTGEAVAQRPLGSCVLAFSGGESSVRIVGNQNGRGIVVENDGRLELSGGRLRVGMSSGVTWNVVSVLAQEGGDIAVSGNAELLMDFGTAPGCDAPFRIFGTGETTFGGSSRFRHAAGTRFQHGPVFTANGAGETCTVTFADDAAFGDSGFYTGNMLIVGGTEDATARLVFDSRATHWLGYHTYVGDGRGRGELIVRNGCVRSLYLGISVGYGYERYGKTAWHSDGYVEVSGGVLRIDSGEPANGVYGMQPNGLNIGAGTAIVADETVASTWKGEVSVSAGELRLGRGTAVVVGSGRGEGRFVQSGGLVDKAGGSRRTPVVVGFVGGSGTWSMSGGIASVRSDLFVGGVTTNELGIFVKDSGTPGKSNYRRFPADRHTATGRLELTGGEMSVGGDLVLSADGEGTLALGMAANLSVAGALDARHGAKLVVDARGYTGGPRTLATFGGGVRAAFDDEDVAILKDEDAVYHVVVDESGISVQTDGVYTRTVDGYLWHFRVEDGDAIIEGVEREGENVEQSIAGCCVVVPTVLGQRPVVGFGNGMLVRGDMPSVFVVRGPPPAATNRIFDTALVYAQTKCAAAWSDYLAGFGLTLEGTFEEVKLEGMSAGPFLQLTTHSPASLIIQLLPSGNYQLPATNCQQLVYLNSSTQTVDIVADVPEGCVLTNAATLVGNIRLVKSGAGRLRMTSDNYHAGGTLWTNGCIDVFAARAFGTAGSPVTCRTADEAWLHLHVKGEVRNPLYLANSATLNVCLAPGCCLVGDITDEPHAEPTTGPLRLYQSAYGKSRIEGGIVRTRATVYSNVADDLRVSGSVVADLLACDTGWGVPDWLDVPYASRPLAPRTRSGSGCLHLAGSNSLARGVHFVFGSLAVESEHGLRGFENQVGGGRWEVEQRKTCNLQPALLEWRADVYATTALQLGTNSQTVACLKGVAAGASQIAAQEPATGLGTRLVKSEAPVTLTLRAASDAVTSARLDDAVSLTYDPAGAFTQAFVGNRRHRTSGVLTVRHGTLELGGETTWTNVPAVYVVGHTARALVSTTVEGALRGLRHLRIDGGTFEVTAGSPLTDEATVEIVNGGKIRLAEGVALTVGRVFYDGVQVREGVYKGFEGFEGADWLEAGVGARACVGHRTPVGLVFSVE